MERKQKIMENLDLYYNELRDLIYQITVDKDGWLNFSKRLLHILQASYVHIQAIDFSYHVLSYNYGVGDLPVEAYAAAELDFLHYPIDSDPRWGKFLDPERKGWYQCHTHVTDEFVQQSELYQNILLPCHLRYVATQDLIWDEKLCVFWSISTSQQRQPLNQTELAFLDRLLPHLKRIVMVQRFVYEFSLENIVGYHLIDRISQPMMLLNLSGHVVHYNQTMQSFLENNPSLDVIDHKLILPECDQQQFTATLYAIEKAFRYQQDQLQYFKETQFPAVTTEYSLIIDLLTSEKEMSFFGVRPLVMLTFDTSMGITLKNNFNSKQKYYLAHGDLKQAYKLSKRELEVCDLFVNGLNLEQISVSCNITLGSLRTYLKRIFAKTQTNSQTELMRLLMGVAMDSEIMK